MRCRKCDRPKRIMGRGLCAKCYQEARRAGTLDQYAMGKLGRPRKGSPVRSKYTAPHIPYRWDKGHPELIALYELAIIDAKHELYASYQESAPETVIDRVKARIDSIEASLYQAKRGRTPKP
jgi:hypothetical protein